MNFRFSILLMLILSACSSVNTVPLNDVKKTSNGFYYALPKNNISVSFEIKQTSYKKGKYWECAKSLGFNENEIIDDKKEKTVYSIENVTVTPKVYLDDTKIYKLKINQSFLNKTDFSLEYNKQGELTSGSQKIESQIIPFTSSIAGIVSKLIVPGGSLGPTAPGLVPPSKCDPGKIKLIIQEIGQIQKQKLAVLEVSATLSNEQLKFRLDKLDEIENNLISHFTGYKKITTKTVSFEISPESVYKYPTKKQELFRISENNGLRRIYEMDNTRPDSTNIIFASKVNLDGKNSKAISITLNSLEQFTDSIATKIQAIKDESETITGSFFYRIPKNIEIRILKGDKTIKSKELPIPQLGIVVGAPSKLKKFTFKLHPGLGSILSFNGKTDSIPIGDIDSILNKLVKTEDERTIETLENQLKIKELRQKLESENTEDEG
ncbi:DUF4831 family protein [Robertkochia sediminum]|uniref:DUF4831 family protein n=1 Tax=Robertkochia sediminum TaxID=2785326 RepID=UPI001933A7FA|nr:DUF4831 family protein [Robertkochia sediminum]MBL7473091.1 DUF4831 family protein [Robertkochia sediminum]